MTQHHILAALGVGVGIVLGFVVWNMIAPTVSSVTGAVAAA